jgi:hypothetical protein
LLFWCLLLLVSNGEAGQLSLPILL